MDFRFSLQQVLNVKENEKNVIEAEYSEAYKLLESIGEKLYGSLRQKETLDEQRSEIMRTGTSIFQIQSFDATMTALHKKIEDYQMMFQQAREQVEEKKEHLVHMSVDVKKYEKLKETEFQSFRDQNKRSEKKFFDEISNSRYLNQ